ncbi:cobalamin synthase [Aureococcus anophagefferens]|uniref:Cobalamin synthase n=2 Tax=Aureococcus anophagefferens TaxID=44056 RepID=A0ABR1FZR6_AURAN
MAKFQKVPVTILTGFLGSGKTTLLNHILTSMDHKKRFAVIENEFGDVGIDDALLKNNMRQQVEGEELIEMMNGCICCTVRADLSVVLKKLKGKHDARPLDGIIIETTGMADPAPVAQTFFVDEAVGAFARLDGIVTLVDAKHVEQHLDEEKPEGAENEAVEQVAFADRLVLNKTDLVPDEAALRRVEGRLRAINKFAPIVRCEQSRVAADQVLNIGAFDLTRTLEMDPAFLDTDGEHEHDQSVTSLGFDTSEADVDLGLFQDWLQGLLRDEGPNLFRIKGILSVADVPDRYVYHAVHMIFDGRFMDPWAPGERVSKLTFIGKHLDHGALKAGFLACLATPENYKKKSEGLRFRVGARVECNRGGGWAAGTVIRHLYREADDLPGFLAPYQVELDDGTLIYCPADAESCVRRASE